MSNVVSEVIYRFARLRIIPYLAGDTGKNPDRDRTDLEVTVSAAPDTSVC
jgi:hypothetical protein